MSKNPDHTLIQQHWSKTYQMPAFGLHDRDTRSILHRHGLWPWSTYIWSTFNKSQVEKRKKISTTLFDIVKWRVLRKVSFWEWAEEASLNKMRWLEKEKETAIKKGERQEIPCRGKPGLCPKDGKECPVRKEQKQEQQDQNVMSNGSVL